MQASIVSKGKAMSGGQKFGRQGVGGRAVSGQGVGGSAQGIQKELEEINTLECEENKPS